MIPSSSTPSPSSSSKKHFCGFRNPTPPKIRRGDSMERSFPQSLPDINYPKDEKTGLYKEENFDFIYKQDLKRNNISFNGINQVDFVTIKNYKKTEYVRKNNYVLEDYLPENHERQIKSETLIIQKPSNEITKEARNVYHSHSRVMIQIMLRNLLELFLKNREDVILPKIYPVVDKENGEVCGMMSEKIDFQEGRAKQKTIERKIKDNGIPSLMRILGIEDILNGFSIVNVGITEKDKKLVFFDFGRNFLDCEYNGRGNCVDVKDIHHYTYLGKSLTETREKYLEGYNTENGEDGLAETVHPEIEEIVMNTGAGDKEFRKDMAKIIQTRINNAFLLK